MMPTRAWFTLEKERPLYIIEFFNDPVFDLPREEVAQEQSWAMFTHGISAVAINNRLRFHRLAIQEDKMLGQSLVETLEKAAKVLKCMGQELAIHNPSNLMARQCFRASEILTQEQQSLIEALLASHRLMIKQEHDVI